MSNFRMNAAAEMIVNSVAEKPVVYPVALTPVADRDRTVGLSLRDDKDVKEHASKKISFSIGEEGKVGSFKLEAYITKLSRKNPVTNKEEVSSILDINANDISKIFELVSNLLQVADAAIMSSTLSAIIDPEVAKLEKVIGYAGNSLAALLLGDEGIDVNTYNAIKASGVDLVNSINESAQISNINRNIADFETMRKYTQIRDRLLHDSLGKHIKYAETVAKLLKEPQINVDTVDLPKTDVEPVISVASEPTPKSIGVNVGTTANVTVPLL